MSDAEQHHQAPARIKFTADELLSYCLPDSFDDLENDRAEITDALDEDELDTLIGNGWHKLFSKDSKFRMESTPQLEDACRSIRTLIETEYPKILSRIKAECKQDINRMKEALGPHLKVINELIEARAKPLQEALEERKRKRKLLEIEEKKKKLEEREKRIMHGNKKDKQVDESEDSSDDSYASSSSSSSSSSE